MEKSHDQNKMTISVDDTIYQWNILQIEMHVCMCENL
jgi:hypothetical protein